jgi:hypothetical protein
MTSDKILDLEIKIFICELHLFHINEIFKNNK